MFTLGEIIDLAVRIETNGQKAYRKAQKQVTDAALASLLGGWPMKRPSMRNGFPGSKKA